MKNESIIFPATKIVEKIEKIEATLSGIHVTLAKQEENLAHHIRRTDLLEESVSLMRDEMRPISVHVELMNKLTKVFALAVSTAAAATGIIVAASKLLHP